MLYVKYKHFKGLHFFNCSVSANKIKYRIPTINKTRDVFLRFIYRSVAQIKLIINKLCKHFGKK